MGPTPNILLRIAGCLTPKTLPRIVGGPTPNALLYIGGCRTLNALLHIAGRSAPNALLRYKCALLRIDSIRSPASYKNLLRPVQRYIQNRVKY